jgi:F0F1-type ATP synthase assembly protein I
MSDNKKSSLKDFFKKPLLNPDSDYMKYSGLGVQLAATILIFLFIGIWLDKQLDTKFIFTLVLTLIGFSGGFYSFYLNVRKLNDKKKNKK